MREKDGDRPFTMEFIVKFYIYYISCGKLQYIQKVQILWIVKERWRYGGYCDIQWKEVDLDEMR